MHKCRHISLNMSEPPKRSTVSTLSHHLDLAWAKSLWETGPWEAWPAWEACEAGRRPQGAVIQWVWEAAAIQRSWPGEEWEEVEPLPPLPLPNFRNVSWRTKIGENWKTG